ncbi:MAG: hypothetical protein NTW34_06560 [Actinobacteria bacterium]|nr:hypothetical protein [Actinomycetota bacterium]
MADHFDEGFADDLMSLVPPFDVSELATRAEMHAGFGSVRAEMALGFARVDAEFGSVRAEMALGFARVDAEFGSVRAEMHAEFGSLRAEMALGFARVDTKFAELRSEMHQNLRNSNMAMMSLMVALHGLLFAALKIWP